MAAKFELIVGDETRTIDNADVPIRWCASPELVQELEEAGVTNPMVVIVTCTKNGAHEWRTVVPLGDMFAYARFYKAGEMQIFAFVFDGGQHSRRFSNQMLAKKYGDFDHTCQIAGEIYPQSHAFASTVANIIIPEGVFAPEPPEWVKWYVNLMHGDRVEDQCSFRRRALLAFTLKWIPTLLYAITIPSVLILVCLFAYGVGFKHWLTKDWYKHVLHPWRVSANELDDLFNDWPTWKTSSFVIKRYWGFSKQYIWTPLVFSPSFALIGYLLMVFFTGSWLSGGIIAFVLFGIGGIVALLDVLTAIMFSRRVVNSTGKGYMYSVDTLVVLMALYIVVTTLSSWAWIVGVSIIAAVLSILLIKYGLSSYVDKFYDWLDSYASNDYTEIRELLCPEDIENLTTDVNSIPTERQTWRLKYRKLKAKFCKPMQR